MHSIIGGYDMNSAIVFASPGPPPLFFAHSLLSRSLLFMPGRNAPEKSLQNILLMLEVGDCRLGKSSSRALSAHKILSTRLMSSSGSKVTPRL